MEPDLDGNEVGFDIEPLGLIEEESNCDYISEEQNNGEVDSGAEDSHLTLIDEDNQPDYLLDGYAGLRPRYPAAVMAFEVDGEAELDHGLAGSLNESLRCESEGIDPTDDEEGIDSQQNRLSDLS